MKKTIIIFDFDGTIADTYHYIIDISNKLAKEFHYKTILPEEIDDLKNRTSLEIIHRLQIPIMKIPAIIAKAKKQFYQNIASIQPFGGLKEILHQMKNIPVTIGILSSNSSENIKKFLTLHNLDIFDFIHTTSKVWSKNITLRKFLRKNGYHTDQIIYIGDEIRDIIAAKKLGVKIAAVTWGYNSLQALQKHKPDYLIHQPEDLLSLCSDNPSL